MKTRYQFILLSFILVVFIGIFLYFSAQGGVEISTDKSVYKLDVDEKIVITILNKSFRKIPYVSCPSNYLQQINSSGEWKYSSWSSSFVCSMLVPLQYIEPAKTITINEHLNRNAESGRYRAVFEDGNEVYTSAKFMIVQGENTETTETVTTSLTELNGENAVYKTIEPEITTATSISPQTGEKSKEVETVTDNSADQLCSESQVRNYWGGINSTNNWIKILARDTVAPKMHEETPSKPGLCWVQIGDTYGCSIAGWVLDSHSAMIYQGAEFLATSKCGAVVVDDKSNSMTIASEYSIKNGYFVRNDQPISEKSLRQLLEQTGFADEYYANEVVDFAHAFSYDNKVYMYLFSGGGCGGCVWLLDSYFIIDPMTEAIEVKTVADRSQLIFTSRAYADSVNSPDGSKLLYIQTELLDQGGFQLIVGVYDYVTEKEQIVERLIENQWIGKDECMMICEEAFGWEDADTVWYEVYDKSTGMKSVSKKEL